MAAASLAVSILSGAEGEVEVEAEAEAETEPATTDEEDSACMHKSTQLVVF